MLPLPQAGARYASLDSGDHIIALPPL